MFTRRHLGAAAAALSLTLTVACGSGAEPASTSGEAERGVPVATHALEAADLDTWLDGYVPAALEREGVPGAAVAVVHDGEVLTARGFGWADREERVPVDGAETLFRVGSVSKVFTATAVMQLVERGDVDLDADVRDYVDVPLEQAVTLRQLLTHTGGFEEQVEGLIRGPEADVDLAETLSTDPPEQVYEPGTTPAYSNYGNALAGLVVQEVSGQPFAEYVAEHVLEPTGMDSSGFEQPLPPELADRLAQGYADESAPASPFEVVGASPAGALTSSARDMTGFMLAQLEDGAPLMEPGTLRQMHAPALDETSLGGLAAGPRMTLGFFDRSRHGRRALEHGGDTMVFHADLELWPDEGTGVFVALNGSGREELSTARIRDGLLEGFADRYLPGDEAPARPLDAEATERAEALAGTWATSRTVRSTFLSAAFATGQTTIEARDAGRVLVSPAPNAEDPALYEPIEPWVWREVGGSRTLAARVDGDRVDGDRVEAIGVDNAFALLPVPTHRTAGVLLPVVGGSALLLVLATVGWLLARPVRWVRRSPRLGREGRVLRVRSRVGVVAAVLALAGWAVVLTQVMGLTTPPSDATIRVVQALQVVALLGIVPAGLRLVDEVRRRVGRLRVASAAVVLLALVGLGWGAVLLRLVDPDITY